mmetsp:Transcript_19547/g.42453  ORF Transcript_19547/g.42453 Transcript_19547/m.42453 type:complete len:551 (-) Transcript_19547:54-1706(-)
MQPSSSQPRPQRRRQQFRQASQRGEENAAVAAGGGSWSRRRRIIRASQPARPLFATAAAVIDNAKEEDTNATTDPLETSGADGASSQSEESVDSDESRENSSPNANRFDILMDDDSSSGDDDSELSLPQLEDIVHCRENAFASTTSDEVDSEDDSDEDDDAAKCAVCFLKDNPTKWRRLLTLPCCGLEGKEETSSTRFCAACILQMAMTRPDPSSSNEYSPWDNERLEAPVKQFYLNDCQTEKRRIIECPRCRDILIVNVKKPSPRVDNGSDDDASGCYCSESQPKRSTTDWTNPKTAQSITVRRPSFKERCRYAGKKVGVARILWRAAFLHHGLMPREALGRNTEKTDIQRLVSWGIIQTVSGKRNAEEVFKMDRDNHAELIKLLDLPHIHITEEFGKDDILTLDLLYCMGCAIASQAFCQYRLDRAWRMMNRFSLLILFFKGFLPAFPLSLWQEWVVTALNVFSAAMVMQFIFIAFVYAGSLFGVGLTVCYVLRCSNTPKSGWRQWAMAVVSFFAYRTVTFVYNSTYITWFGMIAPKAVIAVKNIIWG